uniref:PurE domain-containing protein n=1 Tax=Strigamia maritima TaxID=126957 RepID=T1IGS4_STRMM
MSSQAQLSSDVKIGKLIIEGKTKIVYEIIDSPGHVLVKSKDRITAGDGVRAHDLEGKAAIANLTNARIFKYLSDIGVNTHFIKQVSDTEFIAKECAMIPIEWVSRRIATGSFLKRNPGVPEGYRFAPIKQETFYKDDINHDPQWTVEQLTSAKLEIGGVVIESDEIEYITHVSKCVFEILERFWAHQDCVLVDMKIEFGVDVKTKEFLLADVIDSDSWRLWPHGDKRLMKDKQVYRDLKEVTSEDLQKVKSNFAWIAEKLNAMLYRKNPSLVVILMGSPVDKSHCDKIGDACKSFGMACEIRITSAHKSTAETLKIVAHYEALGIPIVFIAVAGRSNGLGPVLSGNTQFPVINCPPTDNSWDAHDIWSSLRLPSGLGCSTVLFPEAAAIAAASIIGLNDQFVWAKLKVKQLENLAKLIRADQSERNLN